MEGKYIILGYTSLNINLQHRFLILFFSAAVLVINYVRMTILSRNHDGYITKHEMLETIKKLTEKQVNQKIKERKKDITVSLKDGSHWGV